MRLSLGVRDWCVTGWIVCTFLNLYRRNARRAMCARDIFGFEADGGEWRACPALSKSVERLKCGHCRQVTEVRTLAAKFQTRTKSAHTIAGRPNRSTDRLSSHTHKLALRRYSKHMYVVVRLVDMHMWPPQLMADKRHVRTVDIYCDSLVF